MENPCTARSHEIRGTVFPYALFSLLCTGVCRTNRTYSVRTPLGGPNLVEIRVRNVSSETLELLKQVSKQQGYSSLNQFMHEVILKISGGGPVPENQYNELKQKITNSKNEILESNKLVIQALEEQNKLLASILEGNDL